MMTLTMMMMVMMMTMSYPSCGMGDVHARDVEHCELLIHWGHVPGDDDEDNFLYADHNIYI